MRHVTYNEIQRIARATFGINAYDWAQVQDFAASILAAASSQKSENLTSDLVGIDVARLQGRLEAFAAAMTECSKPTRHEDGSVGGRDCREIHAAIDILHLDTLRQMKAANAALTTTRPRSNKP
ncbi:MAG: hypothetical protein ACYCZR_00375 [Burkholderiales bacterium]